MILFTSRGSIRASIDGRSVTIEGEMLMQDFPWEPHFVAYLSALKAWDDGTAIPEDARRDIMDRVVRDAYDERGMIIEVV